MAMAPESDPFQSIASYQPSKRQLKDICDISWHTPNSTVSSQEGVGEGAGGRAPELMLGWQGPFYLGFVLDSWWRLCLWVYCLGSQPSSSDGELYKFRAFWLLRTEGLRTCVC